MLTPSFSKGARRTRRAPFAFCSRDTDDFAMTTVYVELDINRPAAEVFAVASDIEHFKERAPAMRRPIMRKAVTRMLMDDLVAIKAYCER